MEKEDLNNICCYFKSMVRAEIIYIYALLISLGFGAYSILQQNGAMITIWFLIALILTIFKERIIRLIMRII